MRYSDKPEMARDSEPSPEQRRENLRQRLAYVISRRTDDFGEGQLQIINKLKESFTGEVLEIEGNKIYLLQTEPATSQGPHVIEMNFDISKYPDFASAAIGQRFQVQLRSREQPIVTNLTPMQWGIPVETISRSNIRDVINAMRGSLREDVGDLQIVHTPGASIDEQACTVSSVRGTHPIQPSTVRGSLISSLPAEIRGNNSAEDLLELAAVGSLYEQNLNRRPRINPLHNQSRISLDTIDWEGGRGHDDPNPFAASNRSRASLNTIDWEGGGDHDSRNPLTTAMSRTEQRRLGNLTEYSDVVDPFDDNISPQFPVRDNDRPAEPTVGGTWQRPSETQYSSSSRDVFRPSRKILSPWSEVPPHKPSEVLPIVTENDPFSSPDDRPALSTQRRYIQYNPAPNDKGILRRITGHFSRKINPPITQFIRNIAQSKKPNFFDERLVRAEGELAHGRQRLDEELARGQRVQPRGGEVHIRPRAYQTADRDIVNRSELKKPRADFSGAYFGVVDGYAYIKPVDERPHITEDENGLLPLHPTRLFRINNDDLNRVRRGNDPEIQKGERVNVTINENRFDMRRPAPTELNFGRRDSAISMGSQDSVSLRRDIDDFANVPEDGVGRAQQLSNLADQHRREAKNRARQHKQVIAIAGKTGLRVEEISALQELARAGNQPENHYIALLTTESRRTHRLPRQVVDDHLAAARLSDLPAPAMGALRWVAENSPHASAPPVPTQTSVNDWPEEDTLKLARNLRRQQIDPSQCNRSTAAYGENYNETVILHNKKTNDVYFLRTNEGQSEVIRAPQTIHGMTTEFISKKIHAARNRPLNNISLTMRRAPRNHGETRAVTR